jgi:hypothetical protein
MDREGRRVAWLANLTGQKQEAVVEGDRQLHSVLSLDERSIGERGSEPWRESKGAPSIQLLPYAVACLRFIAS